MEIELLQMRRGKRVGGSREGWEDQGTESRFMMFMYMYQLPKINVIIIYYRHGLVYMNKQITKTTTSTFQRCTSQ